MVPIFTGSTNFGVSCLTFVFPVDFNTKTSTTLFSPLGTVLVICIDIYLLVLVSVFPVQGQQPFLLLISETFAFVSFNFFWYFWGIFFIYSYLYPSIRVFVFQAYLPFFGLVQEVGERYGFNLLHCPNFRHLKKVENGRRNSS